MKVEQLKNLVRTLRLSWLGIKRGQGFFIATFVYPVLSRVKIELLSLETDFFLNGFFPGNGWVVDPTKTDTSWSLKKVIKVGPAGTGRKNEIQIKKITVAAFRFISVSSVFF